MAPYADRTWIIDSGAIYSLVGNQPLFEDERKVKVLTSRGVLLIAANGVQVPDKDLSVPIIDLGVNTNAVMMPNYPREFSIGETCLDDGWGFHWAKGVPRFVGEKGNDIWLIVGNACLVERSRYTVRTSGEIAPSLVENACP